MNRIKIWNDKASQKQIEEITAYLRDGNLILYPTDTLYAIGCDATNSKAVSEICAIKGINPDKTNLSIICPDISFASEYARIDNMGFNLLKQYTPGPFTFLFKASSQLPRAFKGRKIVGVRIPDNETIRRVAESLGSPILTTSIEYDDDDYAINPDLIAESYENRIDLMIEGEDGSTTPSTIIDCTGSEPVIIREGKGLVDL